MKTKSIIILGPSGVGKSTVSKILADKYDFEYIDTDRIASRELEELVKSNPKIKQKYEQCGDNLELFLDFAKHYYFVSINKILNMCSKNISKTYIIELGGNCFNSHKDKVFELINILLENFTKVLLIPSENLKESFEYLMSNSLKYDDPSSVVHPNHLLSALKNSNFREYSDIQVFTKDKNFKEIANEIEVETNLEKPNTTNLSLKFN